MKKLLLFTLLLSGCSVGSYEGKSAEEWFNEYDAIEAKNSALQSDIYSLQSENDTLQSQLEKAQSEYEDLYVDYKDLKACILVWRDDATFCFNTY